MKELYGNSNYRPQGKTKAAPQASANTYASPDNRRTRKANELQSNVLTHADDDFRQQRNELHDLTG